MTELLRDLMARLSEEAGPAPDDPTLWRRARRSRQRRGWLTAAGVAAVLTVGIVALTDAEESGRPPVPAGTSDSDTSSPSPSGAPLDPRDHESLQEMMVPGTYEVPLAGSGLPLVTVDLPPGFNWIPPGEFFSTVPPGYGVGFWDAETLKVNTTDCAGRNETVQFEHPGPTVADFAAALAGAGRRASEPVPVSISGYDGLYLELTQAASSACDARSLWVADVRGGSSVDHLDAGIVDRIWILDVDGHRLVIDAYNFPPITVGQKAALTAIVGSTIIER